jgi:hypothetical protein
MKNVTFKSFNNLSTVYFKHFEISVYKIKEDYAMMG